MRRELLALLAVLAGILLSATVVYGASEAAAHPAKAPHGNGYAKNYYPDGYYAYAEPDGESYLGLVNSLTTTSRGYTSYKRVTVDGRRYYKLAAYFTRGKERVEKPVLAALHKYDDYGSDRPAFRVYMTHKATGKHYWRRFEARNSEPPNTLVLTRPGFDPVVTADRVSFDLWSPDPAAKFVYHMVTPGSAPQQWTKGDVATVRVTEVDDGGEHLNARAYDAAGHIDHTAAYASFLFQ
jgi:hypothetical protein